MREEELGQGRVHVLIVGEERQNPGAATQWPRRTERADDGGDQFAEDGAALVASCDAAGLIEVDGAAGQFAARAVDADEGKPAAIMALLPQCLPLPAAAGRPEDRFAQVPHGAEEALLVVEVRQERTLDQRQRADPVAAQGDLWQIVGEIALKVVVHPVHPPLEVLRRLLTRRQDHRVIAHLRHFRSHWHKVLRG